MVFINKNIIWLYLSLFLTLYSCSDKLFTYDIDCNDCYTVKPDSADIVIYISNKYSNTTLTLYDGKAGSDNIIFSGLVEYYPEYFLVEVDKEYAAEVEYTKDGITYSVIDGTEIKAKRVTEYCGDECWVITNNELDLRLKY